MTNTNEIKINILEVSSTLANTKLFEYYKRNNYSLSQDELENLILIEDEEGVLVYTEDAQDFFNNFYDEYYSILENLEIK